MSIEIEIPNHWQLVKVSKVGNLLRGINYKKDEAVNEPKEGYLPVLRGNNINGDLNFDDLVYVLQKNINDQQLVKADDIVFAMSSGSKHLVGKSAKAKTDFNGSFGAFCGLLRPNDNVNKNYLAYFFKSSYYKKYISEISKGTNINNLKREHILDLDFPLAPGFEQDQIVEKIEELFSELDKGIENLKIAQQQLKVYRQAVLKWAFEGKLTNENVKDGELPKGWEMDSLGQYLTKIESGKSYKCDERPPGVNEVGIIKVSSVTWGEFDEMESKTCFSNDLFNVKYLVKEDDFLFSRANTIDLVGACVIVKRVHKKLMLSDKILRFIFEPDLSKKYALYFLRSKIGKTQIEKLSSGNQESMRNIGQEKIKQINIPYCRISEQEIVIQEIESRFSLCDKMEETVSNSLQQAEALRQSILKRAFEGKLVNVMTR